MCLDIGFRYHPNDALLNGDIESRSVLLSVLSFFLSCHPCTHWVICRSLSWLTPDPSGVYGLELWLSAWPHWALTGLTASLHTKWPQILSHTCTLMHWRPFKRAPAHTHTYTQAFLKVRVTFELSILKNTSCLPQFSRLPQVLCSVFVQPDKCRRGLNKSKSTDGKSHFPIIKYRKRHGEKTLLQLRVCKTFVLFLSF